MLTTSNINTLCCRYHLVLVLTRPLKLKRIEIHCCDLGNRVLFMFHL